MSLTPLVCLRINGVQHSRNTMKNENAYTKTRVANSKAYRDYASNTDDESA